MLHLALKAFIQVNLLSHYYILIQSGSLVICIILELHSKKNEMKLKIYSNPDGIKKILTHLIMVLI